MKKKTVFLIDDDPDDLNFIFKLHCFTLCFTGLTPNYSPRNSIADRPGFSTVMLVQPIVKISTVPNVISTNRVTVKYVCYKHIQERYEQTSVKLRKPVFSDELSKSRGGQIRTDDLLVPNQARYRATLHPEWCFNF
jgi:hypothetical protein